MPDINIQITNEAQVSAAFRLASSFLREELNKVIKESALLIQAESVKNTPVATGRLRASTSSIFGDLQAEVGTHTNYDIYVHNGTRFMKGRPYLQTAVDSKSEGVIGLFEKAVQTALDKVGAMT